MANRAIDDHHLLPMDRAAPRAIVQSKIALGDRRERMAGVRLRGRPLAFVLQGVDAFGEELARALSLRPGVPERYRIGGPEAHPSLAARQRVAEHERFREAARAVADLQVEARGVLLLFQQGKSTKAVETPGGIIPPHNGRGPVHIAFSIAADDPSSWEKRLADFGIEIEARMTWPRRGRSLYFRDPDQHLLELATQGLWPEHHRRQH